MAQGLNDTSPSVKVLVAGGAGFIGSTIASACLDAGIAPVILDNLSTGRIEFVHGRTFYYGDIADGGLIDRIFAEHPDIYAVINAAALIDVPESVVQPLRYYRENVAKSIDLVDHLLRHGCTRYLFSSSAAIYAPGEDFSVDEDSPVKPGSPYARSKAIMEQILHDTACATPLRVLSLRYFNPVGADPKLRTGLQVRSPTHALGKLLTAAEEGSEFQITGVTWPTRDGSGVRDFIHVWDVAQAHVLALQRFDSVLPPSDDGGGYEAIDLGTGRGTTVRELVAAFISVTGQQLKVRETGPRLGDVAGAYTCSSKAAELLRWTPQFSVEDAIRDSLRWSAIRQRQGLSADSPVRAP